MNILILGGTGYVGKILNELLNDRGHKVISIGQHTEKSFKIGEELNENYLTSIDYVFYLAWLSDTKNNMYKDLNVKSLINIVNICNQKNIELIFFSTLLASHTSRSLYNSAKAKCEEVTIENSYKVVRLGSVIVDGYNLEGFYGYVKNFTEKYRVFPIIYPNKRIFQKTGNKELSDFANSFEKLNKNITPLVDKKAVSLKEILEIKKNNTLLIPIHWKIIYLVIRFVEIFPIKATFRSDSLLSIWGKPDKRKN